MIYAPEGNRLHTPENQVALRSISAMEHAMHTGMILEARAVLCDSSHNLAVSLPCMRGIIPREEGAMGIAEGTTKDIALIARAGKPVCFRILRIEEDASGLPVAILSRRIVQEECWKQYLSHCTPGDILPAVVTHLEKFGAFVDIGCGVPSLIGIENISVSRIPHPDQRFRVGQAIFAVVQELDPKLGRVYLTHRELLGTWAENAARFQAGMTVPGIVRGLKEYGAFVELTPNLSGLAERKSGLREGDRVSVYIKAILPERMKIKLLAIDTLPPLNVPAPLEYFLTQGQIEKWKYAPEGCVKVGAETIFA